MRVPPFFSYFGSKWSFIGEYPKPRYNLIVEPFAGSASYACHYPDKRVILYDTYPVIAGLWQYLIKVKEEEIRSLPLNVTGLPEMNLPQEAKWLIGFWLSKASNCPVGNPSGWREKEKRMSRGYWSEFIRERIARNLQYIRHWKVYCESYTMCANYTATWFVDPPYSGKAGRSYKHKFEDYDKLGQWCNERDGQVIACDNEHGKWLPFIKLGDKKCGVPQNNRAKFKGEYFFHRSDKKVGLGLH